MNDLNHRVSQTLDQKREELANAIVTRQYELQAKFWKPFGDSGKTKSTRDAGYHLAYLSQAIAASDPSLFADYIGWVKVLFAGLHFSDDIIITTLNCTREVIQLSLPEDQVALVVQYIDVGLAHLGHAPTTLPSFIQTDAPLADLARQYLDALVQGDRHAASQMILDAVKNQVGVRDIYLHVFQITQYEIGRLWQSNQLTVAQEHFCTAVTQLIISQLYPYIFTAHKNNQSLVATCVGGELHEIGLRMVADFFEMEGWNTYFLGANTPLNSILQTIAERRADLLAISATITYHVPEVRALIAGVRASQTPIKIMVGGYPFNVAPNLWREVGADGYANSAAQAIAIANQLVN